MGAARTEQVTPDGLSYKTFPTEVHVTNEDEGIVEAYVSATGLRDRQDDVIEPGAYAKTLDVASGGRIPVGVYHHELKQPIARTLEVKELLPGDAGLPEKTRDGRNWPKNAGALKVKMQLNLGTQRGREAFSDLKFFEDHQWSVGYKVPRGKAIIRNGVRYIKEMDLYEYSPVLFGAMPDTFTTSVKSAQAAWAVYETVLGDENTDFMTEGLMAAYEKKAAQGAAPGRHVQHKDDPPDTGDTYDDAGFDDDGFVDDATGFTDDDLDNLGQKYTLDDVRAAIIALEKVEANLVETDGEKADDGDDESADAELSVSGIEAFVELKALDYDSVSGVVDDLGGALPYGTALTPKRAAGLRTTAAAFDTACEAKSRERAEQAGLELVDAFDQLTDEAKDIGEIASVGTALRVVADRVELAGWSDDTWSSRTFGPEYASLAGAGKADRRDQYIKVLDPAVLTDLADVIAAPEFAGNVGIATKATLDDALEASGETKRFFSAEDRRKHGDPAQDYAFPIANQEDVDNAIKRLHSAKDKEAARRWILRKAKELGLTVPGWLKQGTSAEAETSSGKSDTQLDLVEVKALSERAAKYLSK
jgi:HK97 family phage prohead protease